MTRKRLRRLALAALLLPVGYLAVNGALFLLRSHARSELRARPPAEAFPAPTRGSRLLVVAAHPDDEALACGGLIRSAAAAGADVRVAFLTTGDGFRMAVEREYRKVRVGAADYRLFAEVRRAESRSALGALGLPESKALFLGYPDKGLRAMWNGDWHGVPYRSPFTQAAEVPYAWAYRPGAPHTAPNLVRDLLDVMKEVRPTAVLVHHPSDDHTDHSAAAAFATFALQRAREQGHEWARACRLHHYLVHRGDWPTPQGLFRARRLAPPPEMTGLDTRWRAYALENGGIDAKARSIECYVSQTAMMRRFLVSFVRRTEVFGDLPAPRLPPAPPGGIRVDGDPADWAGIAPALLDPVNDNLWRNFQRGADIQSVSVCGEPRRLLFRIDTFRRVSGQARVTVRLRLLRTGRVVTAVLRRRGSQGPPGVATAGKGSTIEAALPVTRADRAGGVALSVETSVAGIAIDRTGYRFLEEPGSAAGMGSTRGQSLADGGRHAAEQEPRPEGARSPAGTLP